MGNEAKDEQQKRLDWTGRFEERFLLRRAVGNTHTRDSSCESFDFWYCRLRSLLAQGPSNDSGAWYPQIHLVFKFNDPHKFTEDIWTITIDDQKGVWSNDRRFEMPFNADQIVDKCVAKLREFRGLFVLWKQNVASKYADELCFVGQDPSKPDSTIEPIFLTVPEGASRIASFNNRDGYTDLIVSGKELLWCSAQQCYKPTSTFPFKTLNNDPDVSDLSQIRVAQSGDFLSVWCLGRKSLLSYQEFMCQKGESPPLELTPRIHLMKQSDRSDRFAALQHPRLGQKIFVIDQHNAMRMLAQERETGLWQSPINVMIPNTDKYITFKSYTARIQVHDSSGMPITGKEVKLCCSTSAELLVNGSSIRGSAEGQAVRLDGSGTLTVIIKSEGLASPILTIWNADSAEKLLTADSLEIDPMSSTWSTVRAPKTAKDLKELTLPNGSRFVKSGTKDEDLEKAAKALQDLSNVRNQVSSTSSIASTSTAIEPAAQIATNHAWSAWYWLREQIKQGVDWLIKKADQGWELIVEIAGRFRSFLLKTATQVASAMQQILETISDGLESILGLFGIDLGWADILDVKNVFVNLTTQGLLWGADSISLLELCVNECFEDLNAKVRLLKTSNLPVSLNQGVMAGGRRLENEASADQESKSSKDIINSPSASFGFYHLEHSGGAQGPRTQGQTTVQRLFNRMDDVRSYLEKLMERFKVNFGELAKSNDVTVNEILDKVGIDLLEDAIGLIQQIAVGFLGCMSDLLLEITDAMNKPINIPILSPMYKLLTKGSSLTILDAVALCLAIPATLIYKDVNGQKPSAIPGIGTLITYNALKPELDARMGRLKLDQAQDGSRSDPKAAKGQVFFALPLPKEKPDRDRPRKPSRDRASKAER